MRSASNETVDGDMKIVTVCLDLSPSHGGMYRAVVDVARMLGGSIVTFRDGSGTQVPCVAGIPVSVIDCEGLSLFRRAICPPRRIIEATAAAMSQADVVIVHSLFRAHAMIVHRIARAASIPYVVVPHGALEPALWRSKQWSRRAWMACGGSAFLRDAACVVFATEAERRGAEHTLGWKPRSEVIPFPVSVGGSSLPRADAREALSLPLGRRLILVLGRLAREKRPREIVTAFCAADPEGCDLVMAGPEGDISVAELKMLVPEGMRSRVWFPGALDSARRDMAIAACDVYLSWSCHESFGYAAAEAMAAGMPVILSPGNALQRAPGWPICGICVADDHESALVAALRSCATWADEEQRAMGARAREWVVQRLDDDVVRARWHSLVRALPVQNRSWPTAGASNGV